MGEVIEMKKAVAKKNDLALLQRYGKLCGVRAIREYSLMKPDTKLSVEINLTKEEILKRIRSVKKKVVTKSITI